MKRSLCRWLAATLALSACLVLASPAEATITFNADAQASTAASNTQPVSFGAGKPTAGDLVIVAVGLFSSAGSPPTIQTPTDNQAGNTYALVGSVRTVSASITESVALYYAANVNVSGTFTVTEAPTGGGTCGANCQISVIVLAFSGVATTLPLDQIAGNNPASTATTQTSTATPTTSTANEVVVGVMVNAITTAVTPNATYSVSTNGAQTNNSTKQDLFTEYKIVSSTGAQTATWTSSATLYAIQVGTFAAAGGAAAAPCMRSLLGVGCNVDEAP